MLNKSNPEQWIRGRFYREGMVSIGPVNVERGLVVRLSELAKERGTTPSAVANELLRQALSGETRPGAVETTKAQTTV